MTVHGDDQVELQRILRAVEHTRARCHGGDNEYLPVGLLGKGGNAALDLRLRRRPDRSWRTRSLEIKRGVSQACEPLFSIDAFDSIDPLIMGPLFLAGKPTEIVKNGLDQDFPARILSARHSRKHG
jgi:hypothetical protein